MFSSNTVFYLSPLHFCALLEIFSELASGSKMFLSILKGVIVGQKLSSKLTLKIETYDWPLY